MSQVDNDGDDCKGDHTPFWQFYTSDWAGGTIGFTLEQRGFYFECLRRMWERKDGLPDEIKWLACAMQCDPRTARRLRSFLVNSGKLKVRDGLLINGRALKDIRQWKAKREGKIGPKSGEDQPKLDLISPEKTNDINGRSPHHNQTSESRTEDRSFKPAVIDGGKSLPAHVPRFVSEDALDRVKKLAPGWDRQHLLRTFLAWEGSKKAHDLDRAFLAWVPKFTKGRAA